ncbi:MAG: nucleotidyltransferase family protein [Bacteroidales bacterium]|nr:nucleotidyltransferase family protein [Bacteroidales bacterium]
MKKELFDLFLSLVRLGIDRTDSIEIPQLSAAQWQSIENIANEHGLLGVMLDGVEKLPHEFRPEKKAVIQSIGQVLQAEQQYGVQEHAAAELALLLNQHGIKTYVLKGAVVAECYPKPEHRRSVDMDCFLLPVEGEEDVWERGNRVVEEAGFTVARGFYKNSTFHLPGLGVENHKFMTPFRGNARLKRLEGLLLTMIAKDTGDDRFEGTLLCRPPVMVSALFLIEHAYSHFLHEGLTWRHILDWQMFGRRHKDEVDWISFEESIDEFGFRRFYVSYCRLGEYLVGDLADDGLQPIDRLMLADVWSPLDLHESLHGLKAKFQLAGNYWRGRWKFKHFTDMTWVRALVEWVIGAAFDRHPTLDKKG